ncbi:hypothetical protein AVEN_220406-1 [Araneus ventricosus]|uniref:Uncharacterized protein n=1 Tax=Araneus ventricosus TaxID=182803 RepID=A0A4Y2U6I7_ARAVE|nr:hypothetical protein AVEN_137912-1 [Araneus ventricosus]GBO07309.1 hypothetical protein AVEN_220406-1 [Araneus ventricosus]
MIARVRKHTRVTGRGLDTAAARKRWRTVRLAAELEAFASFLENLGGLKSLAFGTEDRRFETRYSINPSRLQCPPVGVVRKFEEG